MIQFLQSQNHTKLNIIFKSRQSLNFSRSIHQKLQQLEVVTLNEQFLMNIKIT